jgi:hypothetical protein
MHAIYEATATATAAIDCLWKWGMGFFVGAVQMAAVPENGLPVSPSPLNGSFYQLFSSMMTHKLEGKFQIYI